MNKRLLLVVLVGILVALPLSSANASEVFKTTSEMIQWDPDRAYNGYSLFGSFGNANILVDMEGNVVNIWPTYDLSPMYAYLMENGHLRRQGTPPDAPNGQLDPFASGFGLGLLTAGGTSGRIEELDWDGNVVWSLPCYDGVPDVTGDGLLDYGTFRQHHDAQRIWNKALNQYTWLALCWMVKGPTDSSNMGVHDDYIGLSANGFSPDSLMEFTYDGELVWQWCFNDHMVTADPSATGSVDTDGWIDHYGRQNAGVALLGGGEDFSNYIGKLNVNGIHYTAPSGPRTDYQHCNSFDYNDLTGHIAINAKAASEFFVVDHDGTFMIDENDLTGVATTGAEIITVGNTRGATARGPAGDFLYRFGNPFNYDSGRSPGYSDQGDQQMFGTHDIQWIRPYHWRPDYSGQNLWPDPTAAVALPGGGTDNAYGVGDFIMFDNACYDPLLSGSVVLQVNPYIYDRDAYDISGSVSFPDYTNPPDAGYTGQDSNQVTWRFGGTGGFGGSSPINDFYSSYISGNTRMPNGNTVVCSGAMGHFFEVTADGTVVWEYVNPQASAGFNQPATIVTHLNQGMNNSTFRVYRYGPDYPGLPKNIRTQGTLTGRVPGSVDVYADAPTGWGTGRKVGAGGGGGGAAGAGGAGGY